MSTPRARAQQAKDAAEWIAENSTSPEDAERLIRDEFPVLPGGTRNAMALMWLRNEVKARRGHRETREEFAAANLARKALES
jgi:hypothetical protein